MVKIVKFDPKLSTLEGDNMDCKNLTQPQIDDIIRANKGPNAVESMILETLANQEYRLSNGQFLIVSKRSGKGRVETALGKVVRRF